MSVSCCLSWWHRLCLICAISLSESQTGTGACCISERVNGWWSHQWVPLWWEHISGISDYRARGPFPSMGLSTFRKCHSCLDGAVLWWSREKTGPSWKPLWESWASMLLGLQGIFFFFLVLPLYCYQPISLHPSAHMLSHVTPWTAARQAPLSMDFSRQEYWSGLPFPSPYSLTIDSAESTAVVSEVTGVVDVLSSYLISKSQWMLGIKISAHGEWLSMMLWS